MERKPRGYWHIYENCYNVAKKYNSRSEFMHGNFGAYTSARKNGWLNDYTWFAEVRTPSGFWDYEKCYTEAQKYNTKIDFLQNNPKAYNAAYKNGWLNDYTWLKKQQIWNKETCYQEAKKYTTKSDFKKFGKSAYLVACKNGWINDYTWLLHGNIKWTHDACYNEAKKYKSRYEFHQNNGGAYAAAIKN